MCRSRWAKRTLLSGKCWDSDVSLMCIVLLQTLTVQLAAQQLQSEAQALVGGSLWVDPDEAGREGSHRSLLRGVVVLVPNENLKERSKSHVRGSWYLTQVKTEKNSEMIQ